MTKKDWLIISGVAGFNLILRLFRLDSPSEGFFDENVFYIEAAKSYLTGFTDPNFEHPPLGKLIIALGIQTLGDNPWGWRVMSVLFGTLGIVVTYLLAKRIFHSTKIALLASFLLTFDFLWFVFSRTALLEIFLAVFSLTALYFLWNYYQSEKGRDLILFSLFVGLAVAVKWSGALLLLAFGVLVASKGLKGRGGRLVVAGLVCLILAGTVYFLSYLPFLSQNHTLAQVWERQVKILNYHTREIRPYADGAVRPYLWILNPMHVFYNPEDNDSEYIIALANPFFFWGGLIAFIYYLQRLTKKWQKEIGFLVLTSLSLYLPWFLVNRYVFFYYLLSGLPILAIALAKGLIELEEGESRWSRRLLALRSGFLTGNALGFILFYPLLTALPVTTWYLHLLLGDP